MNPARIDLDTGQGPQTLLFDLGGLDRAWDDLGDLDRSRRVCDDLRPRQGPKSLGDAFSRAYDLGK